MGESLRSLLIEDSEEDTQLLLRELHRNEYEVEYERVETAEAMQTVLPEKTWDLILSDDILTYLYLFIETSGKTGPSTINRYTRR